MNERSAFHGLTRRELLRFGAITTAGAALTPLLAAVDPRFAFADSITTLPSSTELVPLDDRLIFDVCKSSVQWHIEDGWTAPQTNGSTILLIPAPKTNGGFSHDNVCDISFTDCGSLDGRSLNATITIDHIEVTTVGRGVLGHHFPIALLGNQDFVFNANGSSYARHKKWFVDYTITVTWADTGQIVQAPFFQLASDIDTVYGPEVNNHPAPYYNEAWTAGDGFTGQFSIFPENELDISGRRFACRGEGYNVDGDDSIRKAGVYAATKNGQFSSSLEMGMCGSWIYVFSSLSMLDAPLKTFQM